MDFKKMMQQAQKLQKEMAQKKQIVNNQEFSIEKQGLKVIATGDYQIKKITFHPVLLDSNDTELIEDLTMLTINELFDQIKKAHDAVEEETTNR
ncbi:MAG: nucleoid-associated protein [Mycoplasma sp.]|nr:nucleoid-associated protein [Mycoplasma sp.]